jgi:hypothetical protein
MRIGLIGVVTGSLFLFNSSGMAVGQVASHEKAEIANVEPYSSVFVKFDVKAVGKQLVIPVCREKEEDEESLCQAYLQRFNGRVWKVARPRDPGVVLGFLVKDYWKPFVIAPGESKPLRFGFSKEFFGIQRGERLRIVLDVWDSPESMTKNDEPDSKLVSPVFVCP